MTALTRAEWIKVTSTRVWWILFIVGAVLTALSVLPLLLIANSAVDSSGAPLEGLSDPDLTRSVWATMGSAQIIALILGIVGFTTEYRHETITDTFLTEPRRAKVIAAKAIVHAGLAILLALLTSALAAALILILQPGQTFTAFGAGYVLWVVAGVVLCYALYAVLGVSVGALITNQAAAVVLALLWVLVIESLIVALLPEVGRWLPGGAAGSVLNMQAAAFPGTTDLLPAGLAVLVLLGYTALFSVGAAFTTLRRDIT